MTFLVAGQSSAISYKVIYHFDTPNAGVDGGLVADAAGNLYGTITAGAASAVFELSRDSSGAWTEKVIYPYPGSNDVLASLHPLTIDSAGNLYGASAQGKVFELSPNADGTWTEKILQSFNATLSSGLTFDQGGNLYGEVWRGEYVLGAVYRLSPNADGSWSLTIIHNFEPTSLGTTPMGNLLFDSAGNLYGTTYFGGYPATNYGAVFELTPRTNGTWSSHALTTFNSTNGSNANQLQMDVQGNVFVQVPGGSSCCGRIIELSPTGANQWKRTGLKLFNGVAAGEPNGILLTPSGVLYGVTDCSSTCTFESGTIYALTPVAGGGYSFKILHNFKGGTDGGNPVGDPILGPDGNIYGSTLAGGSPCDCGVVYEITP
jgi:uncharacterized repeat protein (TIGR03803 family)